MWAALNSKIPCVFLGSHLMGDLPFYDQIMDCFGIKIVSVERPTLFRQILVPSPTMTNDEIAQNADAVHLAVTEKLWPKAKTKWDKPVFLSRAGFRSRARKLQASSTDQEELEDWIEAFGYQIVHPELLPLEDQIALFNEAPMIVGLIGSAFHTAFFSKRSYRGKLALLTFRPGHKRGRYGLIDSIKNYSATYIHCCEMDDDQQHMVIDVDLALAGLQEEGFLDMSSRAAASNRRRLAWGRAVERIRIKLLTAYLAVARAIRRFFLS